MATKIARMDALEVAQVSTITPTPANSTNYQVSINTKVVADYTSDGSATAQEIVEGLEADLTASEVPEALEATYAENDSIVTATGTTGKPFTLVSAGAGTLTISNTVTAAKSPNHWIAENFNGAGLPASNDTVIIAELTEDQSILYGLDQNAVDLDLLDIRANSQALIGLGSYDDNGYYQYRDTHLKISADLVRIGDGDGDGSRRINLDLGTGVTIVTIVKTGAQGIDNDAPVNIIANNVANILYMNSGIVDLGTKPGNTGAWASLYVEGGILEVGSGTTLVNVTGSNAAVISLATDSTITTLKLLDSATITLYGSPDITTADLNGGPLVIKNNDPLIITTLNGYSNRVLDLSGANTNVTITDSNIYATADSPFTIIDPHNMAIFTNATYLPNGAASFRYLSGVEQTAKYAPT